MINNNNNIMEHCIKLEDFVKEQVQIIQRHITKHQWYIHAPNKESAVADFIDKYGWIMREIFCDKVCEYSSRCEAYQAYLRRDPEIDHSIEVCKT